MVHSSLEALFAHCLLNWLANLALFCNVSSLRWMVSQAQPRRQPPILLRFRLMMVGAPSQLDLCNYARIDHAIGICVFISVWVVWNSFRVVGLTNLCDEYLASLLDVAQIISMWCTSCWLYCYLINIESGTSHFSAVVSLGLLEMLNKMNHYFSNWMLYPFPIVHVIVSQVSGWRPVHWKLSLNVNIWTNMKSQWCSVSF